MTWMSGYTPQFQYIDVITYPYWFQWWISQLCQKKRSYVGWRSGSLNRLRSRNIKLHLHVRICIISQHCGGISVEIRPGTSQYHIVNTIAADGLVLVGGHKQLLHWAGLTGKSYFPDSAPEMLTPYKPGSQLWLQPVASFTKEVNTLRPRQNGRHFPMDFLEWKYMHFD